jgi:hypothetical protein
MRRFQHGPTRRLTPCFATGAGLANIVVMAKGNSQKPSNGSAVERFRLFLIRAGGMQHVMVVNVVDPRLGIAREVM